METHRVGQMGNSGCKQQHRVAQRGCQVAQRVQGTMHFKQAIWAA